MNKNDFRIIKSGNRFQVQHLERIGWFRYRYAWVDMECGFDDVTTPARYNTRKSAQNAIDVCVKQWG